MTEGNPRGMSKCPSFPRSRESRVFQWQKSLGPRRSLPSAPIGGGDDEAKGRVCSA